MQLLGVTVIMAFRDLRAFIEEAEKIGEVAKVLGADTHSEIGPITEITAWSPEHPMILFDEIDGYPIGWRIAVHSLDSYKRMQLVYGFPDGIKGAELTRWWKNKLDHFVPVGFKEVEDGPVFENIQTGDDVNLYEFPAPLWHQKDAGPYLISGGATVLKDPETGKLNVGCYRGMLYDRNTLGHHLAAGHNGQVIRDKYFALGKNCPVAVSLGHDPSFQVAASEGVGFNENEFEFGGFLRGEPYEVVRGPLTGLPFLSTSEIVLEGEILHPDNEPQRVEAPWGEAHGYYSSGFPQPPLRINAVYRRDNPIILGDPTLRYKNRGAAGGFPKLARAWHMLELSGLEGIKGIGRVGPYFVISIKQYYSGQALRIADYAMSGLGDRPPRFLVLVDDDIDPNNRNQVEWAISTRMDPASQIHIQRERWTSPPNPAGLTPEKRMIEDYTVGTMIIDACKPFRWREDWDKMFLLSDIDEKLRKQTADKWSPVLGQFITEPKPR